MTMTGTYRLTFDFPNPVDNLLEMTIVASDINDPIRNMRVLMSGIEITYETQPFNQVWLDLLAVFPSIEVFEVTEKKVFNTTQKIRSGINEWVVGETS